MTRNLSQASKAEGGQMQAGAPGRATLVALLLATAALGGCSATADSLGQTYTQGYVVDQQTLALVPVGSSREQVLLSLGTPSTTATFDNEVFYYISQKRHRSAAFMTSKIVDQSILAVYFDDKGTVSKLANYTLQDGRVFDIISRTTPTGGKEMTFLGQILTGNGVGKSMARSIFSNNSGNYNN